MSRFPHDAAIGPTVLGRGVQSPCWTSRLHHRPKPIAVFNHLLQIVQALILVDRLSLIPHPSSIMPHRRVGNDCTSLLPPYH